MNEKSKIRETLELYLFVLVSVLIVFFVTISIFSGGSGRVTQYFANATFYFAILSVGIVGLMILKQGMIIVRGNKELEKKAGFFWAWTFDPGLSPVSELKGFRWLNSFGDQCVVWITFFGGLVAPLAIASNSFVSVPQSVLPGLNKATEILLLAEPASFSETTFLMVIFSIMVGICYFIKVRKNYTNTFFYSMMFIVCPLLTGIFGLLIHIAKYGSVEVNLLYTLFFWTMSAIVLAFSGFLWAPWFYHFFNNGVTGLKSIATYSNAEIMFMLWTFIILLNVFYWTIKYTMKNKKKRLLAQESVSVFD